jgi:hypothetical protein
MVDKGCPRCHGDIFVGIDRYGKYHHCLQCGWQQDLGEMIAEDVKEGIHRKWERERGKHSQGYHRVRATAQ